MNASIIQFELLQEEVRLKKRDLQSTVKVVFSILFLYIVLVILHINSASYGGEPFSRAKNTYRKKKENHTSYCCSCAIRNHTRSSQRCQSWILFLFVAILSPSLLEQPLMTQRKISYILHILKMSHGALKGLIANTHMCLLYGICIVLNSVPLSFDLTVDGPRP